MRKFRMIVLVFWICMFFTGGVLAQEDDRFPEPCSAVEVPEELDEPTEYTGDDLRPMTLFLGFIPNVQFAPLYVAAEKGYFADMGIDIRFEYGDENIGVERIAADELQFGVVSGEQVVLARARELPIVYVFEWFQKFAVGVVAPVEKGIVDPEDMAGHVIGVPGRYGASWTGFIALLDAVGLAESDLGGIEPVGFAATEVVCAGRVDASVVYISNEPVQIREACTEVDVIRVADYADLVANGLVTNEETLAGEPELVQGMVWAFARGLEDTISDPEEAYELSRAYVEDLPEDDPLQMEVLLNSIELWEAAQLGYTDPESWTFTMQTLVDMELIEEPIDLSGACTNVFLLERDETE